ncbi:RDD family protein [Aetokthonos hydrillicola Thurmond2011]|jgi:serine/threonine-protein kinase|uniref:non-specific serine/threonine protein kinase n=1 Tax=Aetokthonos hydrillicola Thurmond2011 TaxID=2712845 RepID=A0AAP5I3H8_9CYAN|nr:RDD family protein [Aetokthonos hydrillicola]MBO3462825.1 protein kinase [Aetokthonos hydrillicola CCALA 1050]MBW4585122.1 RDD family protein [Aetokthonos hydrillicola CCALA 1050]MDR9894116.1 RDD family protein [Aetokthonos hydrillicola Thurmond2011]
MPGIPLIGITLGGRYYVADKLGEGGIGETYIAIDRGQPGNYQCVIKRLKPQSTNQSTMRWLQQSFEREATTLQKLGTNDQIPRLLAFFEENQEFFLVQEFIDGNNLRSELSPGRQWHETQVIFLLRDILEVLQFVHHQKVIHRDLKPENLIRRRSDQKIVLIDFGAVKEVSTQVFNTQGQVVSTTFVIGTPGYMPAEQLRQNPMLCSDIYAVGMIALEALTGIEPKELLDSYTGNVIWRNRVYVRNDLANVLDMMVHYHPNQRYQSASQALLAVQELTKTLYNVPPSSTTPLIKYAGFWRRLAADFIDKTILIVCSLFLEFIQFGAPDSKNEAEFWGRIIAYYVLLGFLYCPVMESSRYQGTLGKMVLGIIVTDMNGNKVSWEQAVKRYISKLLSYITIFIGFFIGGFTNRRQTLHDKVSRCLVIRKD